MIDFRRLTRGGFDQNNMFQSRELLNKIELLFSMLTFTSEFMCLADWICKYYQFDDSSTFIGPNFGQ